VCARSGVFELFISLGGRELSFQEGKEVPLKEVEGRDP
jgi:hypothetical protein